MRGSMTEMPILRKGDVVTYGGMPTLYKITHVKQVKAYAIESVTGRRVELRMEHCKLADASEFVDREEDLEPAPQLALGMAVRFKEPSAKTQGVFVTLDQKQGGWRVARLGGKDGMRYFYNIDAKRLVPVDEINSADWR